jgi:Glycosyl transferase family 2
MTVNRPRVSIGLPVYNGENYLAETLDSILAQTFRDFELIISDNASTDGTEAICRRYAASDQRIRYVRNAENLGAAKNYNRVFQLARGEYFKWNGHDDPLAPTFLERCVEALDRDPELVLCFARIRAIDARGDEHEVGPLTARTFAAKPQLGSAQAHVRFYHTVVADHPQGAIFGLIRQGVLAQTALIGSYRSSDLTLLGELALRGRFHQIPEPLQDRRFHAQQGRATSITRASCARSGSTPAGRRRQLTPIGDCSRSIWPRSDGPPWIALPARIATATWRCG